MTLQIELTPEDESHVSQAAEAVGMTRDEYVRFKVLEGPFPEDILTEIERDEIRAGIRRGLQAVSDRRTRPLKVGQHKS